uniref:Uncharacterized protein n=1 Tax=Anopheles maculatus TaxID=74869 RepID=A0A182SWC1_9DIPT
MCNRLPRPALRCLWRAHHGVGIFALGLLLGQDLTSLYPTTWTPMQSTSSATVSGNAHLQMDSYRRRDMVVWLVCGGSKFGAGVCSGGCLLEFVDGKRILKKIDGHDSGTESDGDLEQEDDLIQEHEMELSKLSVDQISEN